MTDATTANRSYPALVTAAPPPRGRPSRRRPPGPGRPASSQDERCAAAI